MTNETKVFRGTLKTIEASGASCANGAVVKADDSTYSVSSDGADYPDAEPVLTCAYATAPTEGSVIALYAAPQDIDSTNDSPDPEATRPTQVIGFFVVDNTTSTQYLAMQGIVARDLPKTAFYWLHNVNTGQTISSGWKLTFLPRTKGPA